MQLSRWTGQVLPINVLALKFWGLITILSFEYLGIRTESPLCRGGKPRQTVRGWDAR
jgi:hypothetical protein